MPAIQAMRSDALAMRAKEDVQEKIPSFFNSVNQSMGQSIMQGQDAAEQLIQSRFDAANAIVSDIRKKVDGKNALSEQGVAMSIKAVSNTINAVLTAFSKPATTDIIDIASGFAAFSSEITAYQLSFDAAAATYAQWTVQAGYTGHDTSGLFGGEDARAIGGRGAVTRRDALTPRWTDRNQYSTTGAYDTWYQWGSVGSISRVGRT